MVNDVVQDEIEAKVFFVTIPTLLESQIESLIEFLSLEEKTRATRFVFAKDRNLYVAAHALLRWCLGAATGNPRWHILGDKYGKPALEPPCGEPPLCFNLSHTNGMAACALIDGCAVGIDVEQVNPGFDFSAVAQWAFSKEEQGLVSASSDHERLNTAYRLWTLKEAVIKASGRGLTFPLQQFEFTLAPLALKFAPALNEDSACWCLWELAPTMAHRLALAVKVPRQTELTVVVRPIEIDELIAAGAALAS